MEGETHERRAESHTSFDPRLSLFIRRPLPRAGGSSLVSDEEALNRMNLRCLLDRSLRATRAGATWSALAVVALFVLTVPAFAAPVLDGNITDVISQANTYISNGT